MSLRNLALFVHLLAAFTWVGSTILINVLGARALRSGDPGAIVGMASTADFTAKAVFNPAGATVLLAGIVLVLDSETFDFATAWVIFAIVVVVSSAVLGMAFYGRRLKDLFAVAEQRGPADPAVAAGLRAILRVSNVEALFLVAVAWAMVFKPGA